MLCLSVNVAVSHDSLPMTGPLFAYGFLRGRTYVDASSPNVADGHVAPLINSMQPDLSPATLGVSGLPLHHSTPAT